ncbi:MAG: hypothetical protein QM731_11840 [Chitinophagaceae bacterium]
MNLPLNRSGENNAFAKPLFWLFLLSTIGIWIFVWQHAFYMDITNDEAYSFFLLKVNNYRGIPGTANTHWLNSLFMRLWMFIFGDHPLSLRLHSVLAFPFFTYAVYKLAGTIRNIPAQVIFYCLLVFNPYVLDFFSLARGYGMALTFQAWCFLLFFSAIHQNFNYRLWIQIVILSALMLAANLSYLYTLLGIAGAFFVVNVQAASFKVFFRNQQLRVVTLLFSTLICFAIADLMFIRIHGKDLEFGGDTDFLYSLMGSVWNGSLYFSRSYLLNPLIYSSFILLCLACLYHIQNSIRQKKISAALLLCAPLLGIFILNLCFHYFFHTPYLMMRTALQWLVPGLFIIFYTTGELSPSPRVSVPAVATAVVPVLLLLCHLFNTSDKYLCFEWFDQSHTKQPLYDLYALNTTAPLLSITFEGPYKNYYQVVEPKFYQYRPTILLEESGAVNCDTLLRNNLQKADYSLIYLQHTLDCMKEWNIPYTIIKTYNGTPLKLVKINLPADNIQH